MQLGDIMERKSPLTLEQDLLLISDMRNSVDKPSRRLKRAIERLTERLLDDHR